MDRSLVLEEQSYIQTEWWVFSISFLFYYEAF